MYKTDRLRISWSHPVCLSLRLVVPLKLLQPLINVSLGLTDSIQKIQIQAMYTGLFKDPQTAFVSDCHLAPGESMGVTTSVTRRWTGFWSDHFTFKFYILHSLQPLASLLWFYSIVITLSQLFVPHSTACIASLNTGLPCTIKLVSQQIIKPIYPLPMFSSVFPVNITQNPVHLILCTQRSQFLHICSPPPAPVTRDHAGVFAFIRVIVLEILAPDTPEI